VAAEAEGGKRKKKGGKGRADHFAAPRQKRELVDGCRKEKKKKRGRKLHRLANVSCGIKNSPESEGSGGAEKKKKGRWRPNTLLPPTARETGG